MLSGKVLGTIYTYACDFVSIQIFLIFLIKEKKIQIWVCSMTAWRRCSSVFPENTQPRVASTVLLP